MTDRPMTDADRAALLESVRPWLILLAVRRAEGTRVGWEVLFQEAALRVYRAAHTYDPARGRPTTWAAIVARSAFGRVFGRLARQPRTVRLVSPKSDDDPGRRTYLADPAPGPAALIVQREAVAAVREAVARLPDPDRAVLTRAFGLDGRPPESATRAAKSLGLARHVAVAALARGLAAVRDSLAPPETPG